MASTLGLDVGECPTLRAPVLLAAFAGWGDAAVAGTGALQYLVGKHAAQRLAGFDPDAIYQYTATRPINLRHDDGTRELVWPSLELHACRLPSCERDALLLVGPEPDLCWRACADAILEAAVNCGAEAAVVLGSVWDRVTHFGRARLSGRGTDAPTRESLARLRVRESRYQGPTGFTSAVLDACARRGVPGAGLSARAPHYAQGIFHPRLACALLDTVERLHGTRFDLVELRTAADDQVRQLTERLQQEPKLWAYVQQLAAERGGRAGADAEAGEPASASAEAPPPSGPPDLPTGSEMVDAVEAFFRGDGR